MAEVLLITACNFSPSITDSPTHRISFIWFKLMQSLHTSARGEGNGEEHHQRADFRLLQLIVPSLKAMGGWRPIINLDPLNLFVKQTRFHIQMVILLHNTIWHDDFMDLKDAYFQIPIHPESRPYLCVMLRGVCLSSVCFGLSAAPGVFTKYFTLVSNARGISLLRCLDDFLVIASSLHLLDYRSWESCSLGKSQTSSSSRKPSTREWLLTQ